MTDETFPGGLTTLGPRYSSRRKPLWGAEEGLPPLSVDLKALHAPLPPEATQKARPEGVDDTPYEFKYRQLAEELTGTSRLAHLNACLIATLRRRRFPDRAPQLFQRLWAEEGAHLLDRLDLRWQVSSLTTFGDHGVTEAQRRTGLALTVLFNTMKIYESERLFTGLAPDKAHSLGKRSRDRLPLDMQFYSIPNGGLEFNLLTPLWREAKTDPVTAPLALNLLDELNRDPGTVFRRLARMRDRMRDKSAKGIGG